MSNRDVLEDLMDQVVTSLFATYGQAVARAPSPRSGDALDIRMAAIIGFTGRQLRGTLMLSVPHAALERTRATAVADRDWLAELCNQVLGRLKNQLARYEVDITLSTPLVIQGERLSPSLRGEDAPLRWRCADEAVLAWVDAEVAPGLELAVSSRAVEVVAEGESMLF